MAAQLTILGSKGGPAIRPGGPMPTSSLLEIAGRRIVVDCGLGVTRSLVATGMNLKTLDIICITHLHSDHVLELGALIHTAWTTGITTPIHVYGPPGIEGYWQGFMAAMAFDCGIRVIDEGRIPIDELVHIHTYTEGPVFEIDGLQVDALRVVHPPVHECFALRFRGDVQVTFSADTCYHPPLIDFARHSDILVHEAMLVAGLDALVAKTGGGDKLRNHLLASHTTAEQVAQLATAAEVKHLVLHHLVPADDPQFTQVDWLAAVQPHWSGPLSVGYDGLTVALL
ncbi:MAG: MBL fold metallo-hydrolase [Chloroflexi bacterium]|nr:MBL fold metallo-hydrolase [Chloroflexota bacterium]